MKTIPTLGAALTILVASGLALAETSSAPLTRAEVKAETRALQSAHKLAPAGRDGINNPYTQPSRPSGKARSERKAETLAARKNGELRRAGDGGALMADQIARATKTITPRADIKAQTRAAQKAGRLAPAGERLDAKAM